MKKNNWGPDDNGTKRVLIGVIFLILTIILVNIIAYSNK